MDDPFDDICVNRHGGNPESLDANADTAHRKERDRAAIVRQYRSGGPQTCFEIEVALGMSHQTCSARISELKADGILEPTPERRPTSTGSLARVLRLAKPKPPAVATAPAPAPSPVRNGQRSLFEGATP